MPHGRLCTPYKPSEGVTMIPNLCHVTRVDTKVVDFQFFEQNIYSYATGTSLDPL